MPPRNVPRAAAAPPQAVEAVARPAGVVADVDPGDGTHFLEAWARAHAHAIVPAGADKAFLGAGKNGWTLPIPIVRAAALRAIAACNPDASWSKVAPA